MNYQPPPDLPTEFALALACCRWVYANDSADAVARLAASADWSLFLAACRRHRVQGLAWRSLNSLDVHLPAPIQVALASDGRAIAEQGLRAAQESARLLAAFKDADVPLLFLKGLPLAKLAFGEPFLKMSSDVDVLVLPEHVARSASLLRELGYLLELPGAYGDVVRWHASRKESVWRSKLGLVLELHSRVADQAELVPGITALSPNRTVPIAPRMSLPTLADSEQFAYLSVHGASSAWFRLKWITDFAAFLHNRSAHEIETLYERSQQLGAGRASAQALLLARRLYAVPLAEKLAKSLNSPVSRWLARAAMNDMLRGEPTERPFGTRTIHLTQFFLLPGLGFKFSELKRQVKVAAGILDA